MKKIVSINPQRNEYVSYSQFLSVLEKTVNRYWGLIDQEFYFEKAKTEMAKLKHGDFFGGGKFLPQEFFDEFRWVTKKTFLSKNFLFHHNFREKVKLYLTGLILYESPPKSIQDLLSIYFHVDGPEKGVVQAVIEELFIEDVKKGHNLLSHYDGALFDKAPEKAKTSEIGGLKAMFKAYKDKDIEGILDLVKKIDGDATFSVAKDPISNLPRKETRPGAKYPLLMTVVPLALFNPVFRISYKKEDLIEYFIKKEQKTHKHSLHSNNVKRAEKDFEIWKQNAIKKQKAMYEAILRMDLLHPEIHSIYKEFQKQIVRNLYNLEGDEQKGLEELFNSFINNDPFAKPFEKFREALLAESQKLADMVKVIKKGESKNETIQKFRVKLREAVRGPSAVLGAGCFDKALEAFFISRNMKQPSQQDYDNFRENIDRLIESGYFDSLITKYYETKVLTTDPDDQENEKLEQVKTEYTEELVKAGLLDRFLSNFPFKIVEPNKEAYDPEKTQWAFGNHARTTLAEAFIDLAKFKMEPRYILGLLDKAKQGFSRLGVINLEADKKTQIYLKAVNALIDIAVVKSKVENPVSKSIRDALFKVVTQTDLNAEVRRKALKQYVEIADKTDAVNLASLLKDKICLDTDKQKKGRLDIDAETMKKMVNKASDSNSTDVLQLLANIDGALEKMPDKLLEEMFKKFESADSALQAIKSKPSASDADIKKAVQTFNTANEPISAFIHSFGYDIFNIEELATISATIAKFKGGLDSKTKEKFNDLLNKTISSYQQRVEFVLKPENLSRIKTVLEHSANKDDITKLFRDILKSLQVVLFDLALLRIEKVLPQLGASFALDRQKFIESLKEANSETIAFKGIKAIQDIIEKYKDRLHTLKIQDQDIAKIEALNSKTLELYNDTCRLYLQNIKIDTYNLEGVMKYIINNPVINTAFLQNAAERIIEIAKTHKPSKEMIETLMKILATKGFDKVLFYQKIASMLIEMGGEAKKRLYDEMKKLSTPDKKVAEKVFASDDARIFIAQAIVDSADNDLDGYIAVMNATLVASEMDGPKEELVKTIKRHAGTKIAERTDEEMRKKIRNRDFARDLDPEIFVEQTYMSMSKTEIQEWLLSEHTNPLSFDLYKKLADRLLSPTVDQYAPANLLKVYAQLSGRVSNVTIAIIETILDKRLELFNQDALYIDSLKETVLKKVFEIPSTKEKEIGINESYYKIAADLLKEKYQLDLYELGDYSKFTTAARNVLANVFIELEQSGQVKPRGALALIASTRPIGHWLDDNLKVHTARASAGIGAKPLLNIDYALLSRLWEIAERAKRVNPNIVYELKDHQWQKTYINLDKPMNPFMPPIHNVEAQQLRNILGSAGAGIPGA